MPAALQVGLTYRQEYYAGEAEDNAKVLSLDEQAGVPFGHFNDVLLTKEINRSSHATASTSSMRAGSARCSS